MDVISSVLAQVRMSGVALFRARLSAPWCVAIPRGDEVLAPHMPGRTMEAATFHVVLDGQCMVDLANGESQSLGAGEMLVLPHGDPHQVGDLSGREAASVAGLMSRQSLAELDDLQWPGDGACTRIFCGYLGYHRAAFTPLFDALPRMFQVPLGGAAATPSLDGLLRWLEGEIVARRPGGSGLRLRMAELLFIEALRRYMETIPEGARGWLAALRDPALGRALSSLHRQPARHWDVASLAQAAATSRSSLAARFVQVLDTTPMQYLARWRMQLAARHLRERHDSVEAIAASVGYDSSAAFQRAFKRQFGLTPARWRRGDEVPSMAGTAE